MQVHGSCDQPSSAAKRKHGSDSDEEGAGSSKRHESNLPGKIVLTAETACEIYAMRPSRSDDSKGEARAKSHSAEIARKYGVTAKTIRDIWNRSTWSKATRKLWTEEETRIYHHNKLTRHHKLLVQTIKEQGDVQTREGGALGLR